jgi:hypothetical protein
MGYIFVVSVIPFRHVPQFRAEHVQCEDYSLENVVVLTAYFGNFASYSSSKPNQLIEFWSSYWYFAFLSTLSRIIIIIITIIVIIIIIFICLARNFLLERRFCVR